MTITKTKPAKTGYHNLCPGCGHGVIVRLIAEVFEELGVEKEAVVLGVGCSCTATPAFGAMDRFQAAHGRGTATATAIKRCRPEITLFTYQGDGDAYVIGLSETVNAAYRNENFVAVVINNNNFGMTGGQMSWTTMPGQVTETSIHGRDCGYTGEPFHLPEIISEIKGFHPAYVARGAVYDVKSINQTKKMLKNAFQAQLNNEGFSLVEILSPCPTNWHMTPLQCKEHIEDEIVKEYPLGELKVRKGEEG